MDMVSEQRQCSGRGSNSHEVLPSLGLKPSASTDSATRAKSICLQIDCPINAPRDIGLIKFAEATAGIEPAYSSFAESCLTTWLRGHFPSSWFPAHYYHL